MFSRAGAVAPISLVLAIVAVMALAAPSTAKPTRSTTIDEPTSCHFALEYTYGGVGGGPGLTLSVILYRQEVGTTDWTVVGAENSGTFNGAGAAVVDVQFSDSGRTTAAQYFGYGYLHKDARTIRNSAAYSPMTAPETCG